MKRAVWLLMTLLAVLVSAYATALLLVPATRPPFVRASPLPMVFLVHFAGGALAMAIGPFQFRSSQRTRRPARHRWLGRVYVTAILGSGTAGFALAFFSQGGIVAHAGFGLLSAMWLGTTILAFVAIRKGDRVTHRQWMLRSFSLTLAAVTLRIYLPLSGVAGIPFEVAYPGIAWACWVPNLAVAELWFVGRSGRRAADAVLA